MSLILFIRCLFNPSSRLVETRGTARRYHDYFVDCATSTQRAVHRKLKYPCLIFVTEPARIEYSRTLKRRVGVLDNGNCGQAQGRIILLAMGPHASETSCDIPREIVMHEIGHVIAYQHGLRGDHPAEFAGKLWAWR